ncbi:hypothetical protein SDRG_08180 [Saprolegnia diclina VS20]|uniref:Uncharacterized protein n=1 Tax=Saprolegnia diclina (strain VS20) TaxID=1156394 RepID=T0QKT9_SAPDV|nr:hypothetical protein SDRG_08180 [Saprolegnia diclina VS20]EQC34410.1 hypothetical protein SDRG_08180 [Saprolegnia diclina VS20]|eukprot:XP_008612272.1 hypothetical protein SDRG_08180 [Saprolegnia diclina VS20]
MTSPTTKPKQSLFYTRKKVPHRAYLEPSIQNIPASPAAAHLRPPPPRLPTDPTHFIGIASYRDGFKCGYTLWTAFTNAQYPDRVFLGVVDQTGPGDLICLEEYCRRAKETWPDHDCRYKANIKIDARDARLSKGPVIARWQQQQLIGDQDFCMELDAHSKFLADWDVEIVKDWLRTENEMAVFSNYPMAYSFISPGDKISTHYSSHLASYLERSHEYDIPVIGGYLLIDDSEVPQMSALWGGCLSFSKCHAEKRAPMDKYMKWIFWGEEYLRSMQLWTHGYDIYSPSRHGHIVFHNWTNDPQKKRFWDNVTTVAEKPREEAIAYNRLRTMLTLPFQGEVDTRELHRFGPGRVRSIAQFLNFSGISNTNASLDEWPTAQRRWVPYSVPDEVEELLPGWTLHGSKEISEPMVQNELQKLAAELHGDRGAQNTSLQAQAQQLDANRAGREDVLLQKLATKLEEARAANEATLLHIRQEIAKLHAVPSAVIASPALLTSLVPMGVVACALLVLYFVAGLRRARSAGTK